MGKVLEMTRMRLVLLIGLLATALSACSSDTTQSGSGKRLFGKSELAAVSPRTAALGQQGAPAYVAVLEAREGAQTVFLRQTVNAKAEETWISNEELSLGMKRGMVLATRGFGGDVLAIDASQTHVTGTVRLKLYKGHVRTVGRWSDHSLYSEAHVTFEDDAGAYDQKDAAGFIQLNALRLKLLAARDKRLKG